MSSFMAEGGETKKKVAWRAPYTFTQDALDSIAISFVVGPGVRSRDLNIAITKTGIKACIKGQPSIVEGSFFQPIKDSLWQLDSSVVTVHLDKAAQGYWPLLISAPLNEADPRTMDPHSRYIIGRAFKQELYDPEGMDAQKAFEYIKEAAESGHAEAQFEMGRLYRDGNKQQGFVIEPNLGLAFNYFKMAADQGLVEGAFQIGLAYHNGSGVSKSIGTALEWYDMCGDYAYAQFNMGIIHLEETDHYNPIRARQHFAKAVQIDPLMRKNIPFRSLERALLQWEEAERQKMDKQRSEGIDRSTRKPPKADSQTRSSSAGDSGKADRGAPSLLARLDLWNVAGLTAAAVLVGAFALHYKFGCAASLRQDVRVEKIIGLAKGVSTPGRTNKRGTGVRLSSSPPTFVGTTYYCHTTTHTRHTRSALL